MPTNAAINASGAAITANNAYRRGQANSPMAHTPAASPVSPPRAPVPTRTARLSPIPASITSPNRVRHAPCEKANAPQQKIATRHRSASPL